MSASAIPDDTQPNILLTAELVVETAEPTESALVLRLNYCTAIRKAAGMPLILPSLPEVAEASLDLAEGNLVTGTQPGQDVDPDHRRFERDLVVRALERGLPALGICSSPVSKGRSCHRSVFRVLDIAAQRKPMHSDPTLFHNPNGRLFLQHC